MTKQIKIIFNNLKMIFSIKEDRSIFLNYLGTKRKNFLSENSLENYRFLEIGVSGENQNEHHGIKHIKTNYGSTCKYVSHRKTIDDKGILLELKTKNETLEVVTFIKFYYCSNSFTIFNKVINISKEVKYLEFVSSFYISCFGFSAKPSNLFLHKAYNSWHCESQWMKQSFYDLGLYTGNSFLSIKKHEINNTGSWSTKEYLPMCVVENKNIKTCLLAQVENNGSWHIEIGDCCCSYYLSASGPTLQNNGWCIKLEPNESFESVKASCSIGSDFEETIQEITKLRRINRRPSIDNNELPIIFNDYMHALWDTQTTDLIKPLVDVASDAGCEEFCIDAGWFAKGNQWWPIIGEWEEYEDNFPNGGLKAVIDYIHSKRMKAGIWFEIEAMGINCPIANQLPDDWFFTLNGTRVIHHSRYQLDFSNKEVYKWAMNKVSSVIEKYNLDYIKNDCNTDSGIGTTSHSNYPGDGLLRHGRAFVRWLEELMDKYPNLTIENCGSGGCRMDNEMLRICPVQSTSDQSDYRKYPYLSSSVLTACTPEQAAVWSYPVNLDIGETITDEIVVMNMVNAMLGRIHLASYLNKLNKEQFELVKEGLRYYSSIKEMKKNSVPVFPNGISHFFDKEVVGGIKTDDKMVLCVWNTSGNSRKIRVNLKKYKIKNIKVSYPTSIKTVYEYNEVKKILIVDFEVPYGGRTFEIELLK